MNDLRTAAQMALEALERLDVADGNVWCHVTGPAIDALRAALAAEPQPVAWRYQDAKGHFRYRGYVPGFDVEYATLRPIPLYTTAPTAQPLTDEQIVMDGLMMLPSADAQDCAKTFEAGVRFAERAHGIGGTHG